MNHFRARVRQTYYGPSCHKELLWSTQAPFLRSAIYKTSDFYIILIWFPHSWNSMYIEVWQREVFIFVPVGENQEWSDRSQNFLWVFHVFFFVFNAFSQNQRVKPFAVAPSLRTPAISGLITLLFIKPRDSYSISLALLNNHRAINVLSRSHSQEWGSMINSR